MKEIILSVKRGTFRSADEMSPVADEQFRKVRPAALKRDRLRCQFCGFASPKYQEVHHLDDDHTNNQLQNLVTACPLCHLCHHVGYAGATEKASLIFLGENAGISQAALNHIVRTLWIAKASDDKQSSFYGVNFLSRLFFCTVLARRRIGTSDPEILGNYLSTLGDLKYRRRAQYLKGIYLLPSDSGFQRQINYWGESVYDKIPVARWVSIASQKLGKWSNDHLGSSSAGDMCRYLAHHTPSMPSDIET